MKTRVITLSEFEKQGGRWHNAATRFFFEGIRKDELERIDALVGAQGMELDILCVASICNVVDENGEINFALVNCWVCVRRNNYV